MTHALPLVEATLPGFLLGIGISVLSFSLSYFVVLWTDAINRRLLLPLGLLTYVVKIVLIGFLVFAVSWSGWPGFPAMLWGIVVGTITWVIGQAVVTIRALGKDFLSENL